MALPGAGGISLKVVVAVNGTVQEKTMRFNADMAIWEVCKEVSEKLNIGGADHGLFQQGSGSRKGRWFKPNMTLKGAELLSGSVVEYKKKHRMLKVKLIDGSNRTVLIDDSSLLGEILAAVCKKVQINNPDEYGLRLESKEDNWLNNQQGLHDQDVGPDDTLVLGKRFFVFDANIDRSDPVQLHLFYSQARDAVVGGKYPVSREEAISLAAFQLQVAEGDHQPMRHKKGFLVLANFLPPEWAKNKKGIEKDIYDAHRKLTGTNELNSKFRYVQLIRNLKNFGITYFDAREKGTGKKKGKWVPVMIGITREKIMRVEPDDRTVLKEFPLKHLKRWAAKVNTFTFDFGDHADEYYIVQTTQGDAMSQLLAGYIDIILKARREAVRQQEEDGASYANPESISHSGGVAVGSTTAAYTAMLAPGMQLNPGGPTTAMYQNFAMPGMQAGQINTKALPKSQKVNVIDLKTAQQALMFLAEELDADIDGAEFEAYDTTMTIDQVKAALGISTANLDKNLAALLGCTDPSNLDIEQLNAFAKSITADVLKLAKMARTAAAIGGANDADIVAGAAKLAASLTKLLEATSKVSLNPHDPKTRAFMEAQNRLVREAMVLLKSAKEGRLADGPTEELFGQFAENLDEDIGSAVALAMGAVKQIKDGNKMREVLQTAKALSAAQASMAETARTLGSALIDPEARKCIADAANEIALLNAKLCDQLKEAGLPADLIAQIGDAASRVVASINSLLNSVALAEPRSGADLDFAVPHSNILAALSQLRDARGDAKLVLAGLKAAMANTTELVGYGRKVAEASDEAGQARLNNTIQNVNDAMGRLIAAAKEAAVKPNDPTALANVADTSNTLEVLTQELVTDAGASAATIGLRYRAKDAVTRAVKTVRILEAALKDITDPNLKAQIMQQIEMANKAIQDLLNALRQAANEPQNPEAQLRLLQAAQRALMPVSQIVAATKRVAPGVIDPNQKQALNYAANSLTDHLQKLMNAIKSVSELEGQQELEEALEQFEATNADLDAAEFAAQGGFLVAPPGQSRDDAVALLDQSVNLLLNDLNNVVAGAKDPRSRKLGEAAKAVAGAAAQVAASVKTVASTTADKTMQKAVLAQAKRFNKDASGVISAARALISRREEPALQSALNNAQQNVLNALSSLTAAARGLDSREVDEAMDFITKESSKLNHIKHNPGSNADAQKKSQEAMVAAAKAVNAALAQLANVARANPRALGPAAKMASTTVAQFINSAATAGTSSTAADQAESIARAAMELINRVNALISAAKAAAARKDQPTYNALNAALVAVAKAVEGLANRNQFPECTTAAERAAAIAALLADPASAKDKGTLSQSQLLAALDQVSANLAQAVQQLVSAARIGSPQVAIFSKDAAENVDTLANAAISSTLTGVNRSTMSGPGSEIMQAIQRIFDNVDDALVVSACTKQIAGSAAKIIGASKVTASKIADRAQQQALLKIAHGFASATAGIARSAQAAKSADYNKNLLGAATELKARTQEIEDATRAADDASGSSSSSTETAINAESAAQLVEASRATAEQIAALIRASGAAASEPDNEALSQELSFSSKSVTDALGDLVKVAAAFNPGKVQLDSTAETLQAAVAELDSAAIQLAIGKIESPVAATKPHKDWQETLVNVSRDLVGTTSALVDATRGDAATLKRVATDLQKHTPSLVTATKAAAATSSDPNLQKNLLSNAKDLTASLLGLVRAAKDANAQNRQSQQALVDRSKKCSQAIGKFVSLLKANAVIFQELDEAAKQIAAVAPQCEQAGPASGRPYHEIRESLQQTVLSIAEKASAINSADKANLGQIGLQARQLCDIMPKFVAQIKDAAATTPDAGAKANIGSSAKALVHSLAHLVSQAKAADPKNPQTEVAITAAFDQSTQVSATVLKAIKSGAVGEMLIDTAIERVKEAVNNLSRNTIFAQAAQLETSPDMATVSVTAARAQLATLAKNIATLAAAMAEATRRTQEQFGGAAKDLAEAVHNMGVYSVKTAAKLPDNVAQQNLLTAAKAAAIASQQLIMTGRETQRAANPTTLQQLTQSVDTTRTCIDQLLQVSESASAEAARGEKGLEDAKLAVQSAIDGFDAFQGAQAEDVIRAAKDLTRAVSELVFAQNQEATTTAAGQLVTANKSLLAASRGASALTQDTNVKKALVGSSANVANASINLLESCKLNREDEQAQNKIEECSSAVTASLSELVKAINQLPNAKNLSVDELSNDKGAEADSEMDKTAKLILDAAKQLDASRAEIAARKAAARNSTSSQKELERLLRQGEVAEAILDAARAITQATASLVGCAAVCQKERKEQPGAVGQRYRNDPTWNNGLISAARSVSDAVVFLVRTANTVLDNKQDEDALVVAARGIATSTAQLVTASKVRGPAANSKSQLDLSAAAKSVATATNQLLVATRNASDAPDPDAPEQGGLALGGKVKEFEEQMRILKLERELLNARKNLGDMRKAAYKQ